MSIAERQQICIWNVLHMNPRPGNDDESKMRGHLGTELGNKISDTLVSIKHKDQNGVEFTVKQNDARGKDLDDWKFEIVDAAGSLGIPKIISGTPIATTEDERKKQEADDYFKQYNWTPSGATYTDLDKWLRSKGVTSNRRVDTLFNTAKEYGILVKSENKKYHYNGINRQVPNDIAEDLPFEKNNDSNLPF